MSINLFFVAILGGLIAIFTYFKPSYNVSHNGREIPNIELYSFVVYEIGTRGMERFFEGKEGKRFEERYVISSAKFSNNSNPLFESIRADNALYKDDLITLTKNVHYEREDGLEFRSDEGTLDQNKSIIRTQGPFVITQNRNRVEGTNLYYNTVEDTVSADAVRGSYQIE